jgi:FeS assembly protein IscX
MYQTFVWDDTYAIACALKKDHPDVELEEVTLSMIYHWTVALDNFIDDPELGNDAILTEILQEWLEEEDN